ncbi:hypothetical protein [Protaetiibacter mangrovi]|uniref:Uncharacterized protein n=1 Tax=Protaetiibacter mangrovi TaxID=2970926 RepID=A0ABT1ZGJ9_9MICO|nr:hypothetical protein [Protaetiibacter mangrovi]MCS0499805.1 hypothetical protein [Protaetiibacter mangrovi]
MTGVPAAWADVFDGRGLASKVGETVLLIAGAEPRVAALSAGEVLVLGERVGVLLYAGSRTTAAVRDTGRCLLLGVADGGLLRIRVSLAEATGVELPPGRAAFAGDIVEVELDRVGYAEVTSGIRFELDDPAGVAQRWEHQIEVLEEVLR